VHTSVHSHNKGKLRNNNDKTPYELWNGRPTNVNQFKVFKRKCYIKREDAKIGKFDARVDNGILVGNSIKRKAYKYFIISLNRIVESINVTVDETNGRKIKESSKDSLEQDHKEYLKE
jgi:hypothetical protein